MRPRVSQRAIATGSWRRAQSARTCSRSLSAAAPRSPWCRCAASISMPSSGARRCMPRRSAVESAPPLTATSTRLPRGSRHGPRRARRSTGSILRRRAIGGTRPARAAHLEAGRRAPVTSDPVAERAARSAFGQRVGGGAGTRTPDTEIMILLLYQLSYAAPKVEGSVLTTGCAAGQPAGSGAFRAIVAQPGGTLLLHRRGPAR